MDTYLTINKASKGIYRDKGSKFIALAYPCSSENHAKVMIADVKKEFFDAHHHCFAYVLGFENEIFRFSDDGEPAGTAGRPIYGQIKAKNLCNIIIVVVRYFGGTKLGVRGLIDAYQGAATDALNQAEIIEKSIRYIFQVRFSYQLINEVMRVAKEMKLEIHAQETSEKMTISFSASKSNLQPSMDRINKIYGAEIQTGTKLYDPD